MVKEARKKALHEAVELGRETMLSCSLCPHHCGVNRIAGEQGNCGATYPASVFYHNILIGEEVEICPSYEIFFTGCNLRCSFCYVADCLEPSDTSSLCSPREVKNRIDASRDSFVSISFIGGEPTVNLLSILEFLQTFDTLPVLVWNTNMYMNPMVPEILSPIMDVYLADIHFHDPRCSQLLGKTPDYFEYASGSLLRVARSNKVIIRHLLIPGHFDCCFVPMADWIREYLPRTPVHLMGNYHLPGGDRLSQREFQVALDYAADINLLLYKEKYTTAHSEQFHNSSEFTEEEIIIERDGDILFTHLTKDFLDVAVLLEPENKELQLRKQYFDRRNRNGKKFRGRG